VRELKNAVEKAVIMARGTRVSVHDITSRRHRAGAEYAAVVSVPVGATLAEARRQLVLKTLASTNGDIDQTAKTTQMSVADVRGELQALLERRAGDGRAAEAADAPAGVAAGAHADAGTASGAGAEPGRNGTHADGNGAAQAPPVALPDGVRPPVGKGTPKPAAGRVRKGA
jgi:hypothetical protein